MLDEPPGIKWPHARDIHGWRNKSGCRAGYDVFMSRVRHARDFARLEMHQWRRGRFDDVEREAAQQVFYLVTCNTLFGSTGASTDKK